MVLAECHAVERVARLTAGIEELVPDWELGPVAEALQALRGVAVIRAVIFMSEIGDVRRFENLRKLMADLGLVPSEYSTGQTTKRGGMSCTIVIPHKDRIDHLRWSLRSLKAQKIQLYFEVIVVDYGSQVLPEDVLEAADLPKNMRLTDPDSKGPGRARNSGWQASAQDIIIFLDCDQIV